MRILLIAVVVDVKLVNPEIISDWLALRDNNFVDCVVERTLFKDVVKPVTPCQIDYFLMIINYLFVLLCNNYWNYY